MLRKNQQGFSHVLLFILAIVLFAGLTIGFVVLKNKRENADPASKKDTGAYIETGTDDDNTKDSGKKYMIISEWGIKLPVTEKTGTLYYATRPIEEHALVEYIDVYSINIDKLTNANGDSCSDMDFPIAVLGRTTIDKMDTVSDPDSADYQGPSGQFKTFDFDRTYAYSALGFHQSAPACAFLSNVDPDAELETDEDVIRAYDEEKAAILESFNKLQED